MRWFSKVDDVSNSIELYQTHAMVLLVSQYKPFGFNVCIVVVRGRGRLLFV